MTSDEFDALVRRLERLAEADPARYRRRVRAWVLLGYAVPTAAATLGLAAVALLVYIAFGGSGPWLALPVLAVLIAAALTVAASLWLRMPPPAGVGLDRRRHAPLYAAVDRMSDQLGAARVHHILVDDELNAQMAHLPRFGLFGGYRNYLVVGLPLLYALAPGQFDSVIGHELGHLAGRHGRTSAAVYRTNRVWQRWLAATRGGEGLVSGLAGRFFGWYAPRFAAVTFVMRRAAEHEADRAAARVATPAAAAEALARIEVADRFRSARVAEALTEFSKTEPEPPEGIFEVMLQSLAAADRSPHARRWLRAGLAAETEHGDTHPSLSERLAGFGHLAEVERRLVAPAGPLLPPVGETAAARYLGDDLPRLVGLLEQGWRTSLAPAWRDRRVYLRESRAALKALDNKASYARLDEDESWRHAGLIALLRDPCEAVPIMRNVQRVHPKDPVVNLALGATMLRCGDPAGARFVEAAMAESLAAVEPGCEAIADYLTSAGRSADAEAYARRAERHYFAVRSAARERSAVTAADRFRRHDLGGDKVFYLAERLAEVPEVAEAYLVEKVMVNFADRKLYVLGLAPAGRLSAGTKKRVTEDVMRKTASFDQPVTLVLLDETEQPLAATLRGVKGGCIYRRADHR